MVNNLYSYGQFRNEDHELESDWRFFNVSLTVHLSITLANDRLNAQIFNNLLQSSTCTCFEQYLPHPQGVKLY
jgi:hypothetical protein